jgi:hypothetical protein
VQQMWFAYIDVHTWRNAIRGTDKCPK